MGRQREKSSKPAKEAKRRIRLRPAYFALAIVLALFALAFIRRIEEVQRLQAQDTALRIANESTAADNARLQRNINYFGTTRYIEDTARSVFGDTMPGDVPILTRPQGPQVVTVRAAPARPPLPPAPSWQQWWSVFSR